MIAISTSSCLSSFIIGASFKQDYQNLPIDIQTSKLLDWLVDRRHCSLKWQGQVRIVREKIAMAIQDMPENEEIKQLLSGSYIHYFHCLRIVEILRGTEASTKNIFGRYSSQRMKDWQEIVSLYEKENTYLVELASLLVRNVSYEIPSLKKQIGKCQQLQQEYNRKEEECQLAATEMRERFYSSCKQYGITGDDVRRELLALVKDLPSQLDEIGAGAKGLLEAINLYQACVQFVCDSSTEQVVPLLRHMQAWGNTTVYEWRRGVKPTLVERPKPEEVKEAVDQEAIDWGEFGEESASAPEVVDHGISVEGASEEIDWGISLESDTQESNAACIDWGDGSDDIAQIMVLEDGSEVPEEVARGPDALTLLETPETRNQFIDELMELEIFLSQRIVETNEEADILSVSQFQLAPPILQDQTKEKLEVMVTAIQDLIGRLTSLRMQHLFMILASPRYVDRVTELLHQKLKQADLLLLKKELMVQKRQEALEEQGTLEPKLDHLVQKTKELQKLIEADVSKRYNGRPVNLMGASL
ncbi:CDK5 regulatory subunit-associated protein 3 isoform X2 [Hemicordylus capensis]|uniref:CDK5 regulatory subunit-associated protein 3 isoform X2 n=1 Tax=Hemicordylus capensis TaxID=884348 RepID=UPI002304487C|nr:CDK5 regulatory subunit-associated protein 3 isoform X2 [Hemicordylus capensis]